MHVYDQPDDTARFLFCKVPDFALPKPEVVDDGEDEDDYDPEEFGFDPPHPEVTKWLQKGGPPPKVDLSLSKYADDIVKLILAGTGEENHLDNLVENSIKSLDSFDSICEPCGFSQNRSKLISILLSLVGKIQEDDS